MWTESKAPLASAGNSLAPTRRPSMTNKLLASTKVIAAFLAAIHSSGVLGCRSSVPAFVVIVSTASQTPSAEVSISACMSSWIEAIGR